MTNITIHIPPALQSVRPHLQRFFDAMVYKLNRNAHKGTWAGTNKIVARTRLEDEVEELDEALSTGNIIEIILECADVANFSLILADIAIRDAAKGIEDVQVPRADVGRNTQVVGNPQD